VRVSIHRELAKVAAGGRLPKFLPDQRGAHPGQEKIRKRKQQPLCFCFRRLGEKSGKGRVSTKGEIVTWGKECECYLKRGLSKKSRKKKGKKETKKENIGKGPWGQQTS